MVSNRIIISALAGCALFLLGSIAAKAQITFDWTATLYSGSTDYGKMITSTGTAPGGVAPAGIYNITDFIVTSSQLTPVANGYSVSGEQLSLSSDNALVWDGTAVTGFVGGMGFKGIEAVDKTITYDTWTFYQFGSGPVSGQLNSGFNGYSVETLTIAPDAPLPAATPEPGALALAVSGSIACIGAGLRSRRSRITSE